jgi:hypothetical protein
MVELAMIRVSLLGESWAAARCRRMRTQNSQRVDIEEQL